MKRLFSLILALLLVSSFIMGGCINPDPVDKPYPPSKKDTLTIYNYGDPYTLNPVLINDIISASYAIQIFSGLMAYNNQGQLVGDLASSWEVSSDGLLYTFRLHRNIYFHDGNRMLPEDIKFSWTYALFPATGSHMAYSYLGNIVGSDEVYWGITNDLVGVTIIDAYTLQVRVKEASSYFLAGLAYPCTFVVSAKQMVEQGVHWLEKPVGTGPYRIVEKYWGSYFLLERFDDYYGAKASIKYIKFITEIGRRSVEMFQNGEVDIARFSSLYLDMVMDSYGTLRNQVHSFEQLQVSYLAFCIDKAPFDDPLVRQAFCQAIDIEKLAATVFRGDGTAATGLVPHGIFGYNGASIPYAFDPQAALSLIAKSRYGSVANLPTIYLTIIGRDPVVADAVLAIADQWQTNLGVKVEILVMENSDFYQNLSKINANVILFGWMADYAHPQNFLDVLLSSGGAMNLGNYQNSSYDALINQANKTLDLNQAYALYREAEALALTDCAVMPLLFGHTTLLVSNDLLGLEVGFFGIPVLNTVYFRETTS